MILEKLRSGSGSGATASAASVAASGKGTEGLAAETVTIGTAACGSAGHASDGISFCAPCCCCPRGGLSGAAIPILRLRSPACRYGRELAIAGGDVGRADGWALCYRGGRELFGAGSGADSPQGLPSSERWRCSACAPASVLCCCAESGRDCRVAGFECAGARGDRTGGEGSVV